jgi:murein DD-endopeptidase MepM/ murein hydrolase activator NlpD
VAAPSATAGSPARAARSARGTPVSREGQVLARHRSPSGAQADDPGRTTPLRVVNVPGVHRLPAPPVASVRGRATVAAVAAGAVVAGGQTVATTFFDSSHAVAALQPVAQVTKEAPADATTASLEGAIGGDQLLPDPLAVDALDPASQVDVQNLAKAVDIGRELAQQAAKIEAALADGAPEAFLYGESVYVMPAVGHLTSLFGSRWGTSHQGIDVAGPIGTPIYALTDGVVEEAGPATGFGLWVVLRHTDGTQSVYGHVNRMFVDEGERVKAGEKIAEIGNRGYSTGPHLHLEIWSEDGTKINPTPWLRKRGIEY